MKWRWIRKKARRDRSRDFMRHYRVAQRLKARMHDAMEREDYKRVEVLSKRIHQVHDIQVADFARQNHEG